MEVLHYSIPAVQEFGTGAVESGEDIASAKQLITGPVVLVSRLNPRKATICRAEPHEQLTLASTEFVALKTTRADLQFIEYLVSSELFRQRLDSWVQSVTRSHQRAQPEHIYRFWNAWPLIDEQRIIADFLDVQTAKIDTLVAKKRALIEKLAEKRSALISRTVTRGLPPDAARDACLELHANFKASGIEWLGDVPEEWKVAQLRRSCVVLDCKHKTVSFVDDGVPLASIGEVHGFAVDLSTAKQTTEEEYFEMIEGDRLPQLGDIIYSRNATVGDAALVTTAERFCMGQDVCLIRPPEHHPRFLLYLFRSAPLLEQVESLMIGSTFRRINVGQIKAFWICLPPAPEQRAIADFLDRETAKINALTAKVEAAIERLQEYRAALITAAVTGKIDVHGAVPPFTGSTPSTSGATPPA